MSKRLVLFAAAAIFASSPAIAGRFILQSNGPLQTLEQEVSKNGIAVIRRLEHSRGVVVETADASAFQKIESEVIDLRVTEDVVLSASTLNVNPPSRVRSKTQPPQNRPWGIEAIHAHSAAAFANWGAGIKICLVDTGIDKTHPDLEPGISGGRNFVSKGKGVNPTAWDDDNGNGTHVAGIIAARDNAIGVLGVAPQASLYVVKALNSKGKGYLSDVADGIAECVSAGARVINLGLDAPSDPGAASLLRGAVESAANGGVWIVASAGNGAQDIAGVIPAGYPQPIVVAAVDADMNFPSWSNHGLSSKDLSAPGVDIFSTWRGGSYNTVSGTGAAAAHVSGVVALHFAAGSAGIAAADLGRSISFQGRGLVDALHSVLNF